MLSLVSFAGMTLNKCAVLWIGTLTGGPVQVELPPVLVKELAMLNSYRRDRIFNPQLTAIKNSFNKENV